MVEGISRIDTRKRPSVGGAWGPSPRWRVMRTSSKRSATSFINRRGVTSAQPFSDWGDERAIRAAITEIIEGRNVKDGDQKNSDLTAILMKAPNAASKWQEVMT